MSVPADPYRDWLRQKLAAELGFRQTETVIQAAVTRRGWPAMQPFGTRQVVAVLQDVYAELRESLGDARADKWLETTTEALSDVVAPPAATPITPAPPPEPVRQPLKWGHRGQDLPLLLARVHHETALRSLDAVRTDPDLQGLVQAAEWDVQATGAEVRRWETEERLISLRAAHARSEVAEQVRSARAQAELLRLAVTELEGEYTFARGRQGGAVGRLGTQLSHHRLMLAQTTAFLTAFAPLADEEDADEWPALRFPELDQLAGLDVSQHPNVMRASHALSYAEWQSGNRDDDPRLTGARAALARSEAEALAQVRDTLTSAQTHQQQYQGLEVHHAELDRRLRVQAGSGADPVTLARLRFDLQQVRGGLRLHANRFEEARGLVEGLVGYQLA